jgi:hypothetical protein
MGDYELRTCMVFGLLFLAGLAVIFALGAVHVIGR